jgi:hypothetical protein
MKVSNLLLIRRSPNHQCRQDRERRIVREESGTENGFSRTASVIFSHVLPENSSLVVAARGAEE